MYTLLYLNLMFSTLFNQYINSIIVTRDDKTNTLVRNAILPSFYSVETLTKDSCVTLSSNFDGYKSLNSSFIYFRLCNKAPKRPSTSHSHQYSNKDGVFPDTEGDNVEKLSDGKSHGNDNLRRDRFPESATVTIHAPRYINRKVKTRYKYSPIAKVQGVPNDDTKEDQYRLSKHLHICGGAIRGRRLCVPPVYLRPMMNRVKNALFPSLKHMGLFAYGYDCKVIDLFCGSGSVGFEALSYGATHCTFVDLSIQCCKAVSVNAAHCNYENKVRIIRADAMESITSPWLHSINDKFDLLFACPPYEEVIYSDLMKQIANTTILNPNAVVVVEYPREIEYLPWSIEDGNLLGYRNRKYGRTIVATYCYKPTGSLFKSCEKAKDEFVPTTYSRKRLKIEGFLPKSNQDDR